MSRRQKEKDKLISLFNDLLPWPDPERDKETGVCLTAAVSESAQTECGHEGESDSVPRTHETKHRGDGEVVCIGHTEKEGSLCDMWLILTQVFYSEGMLCALGGAGDIS